MNDHHLLGYRWNMNTWEFWHTEVSLKDKQHYFDARIGNIYTNWSLHHSDDAFQKFLEQHPPSPSYLVDVTRDPHMLLGVKMTRDNYNVSLLHIKTGKIISFRHKEYNHWYAVAFRPEK